MATCTAYAQYVHTTAKACTKIRCVCPDALYMIEGTAQNNLGSNWGDGHATDANLTSGLANNADPNIFYQQLVNAPYAGNAILSAHVYGCADVLQYSLPWLMNFCHRCMRYILAECKLTLQMLFKVMHVSRSLMVSGTSQL